MDYRQGSSSSGTSLKSKTSVVKVWKPVNVLTVKSSKVHKELGDPSREQPTMTQTTPSIDMQPTQSHEGVCQHLQNTLQGNLLPNSLITVPIIQGEVTISKDTTRAVSKPEEQYTDPSP